MRVGVAGDELRRNDRAQIAGWAALLVTVSWLSLRGWGAFQVGVYQDDADYLVLARSLAAGGPWGMIHEPGLPRAPKYPFAFPLLLAPVVWAFPQELLAGTAVSLAATLLNVSLLFWGWPLLSPTTSRWWGLGVASLYGLAPLVLGHTRVALSEPVFLSFVLLSLLLTEAIVSRGRAALSPVLGVALTFALFTRLLGISVWAAALLRIIAARRGAPAALTGILGGSAGSLLLILGLTSIEAPNLLPSEYIAQIRTDATRDTSRPGRVARPQSLDEVALGYAFDDLRSLLVPVGGGDRERALAERVGLPFLPQLFASLIAALVGLGMWRAWRERALSPSALLFELFYLGVLMLWPWHTERLLYGAQPFLALQLLLGVLTVGELAWRRRAPGNLSPRTPILVAGTCVALIAASLYKNLTVVDTRTITRDLRVGATWLAENSPVDAIVMARYPQALYLYSGRKAVSLSAQSPAELEQALPGVDYVLLGPELSWRFDGVLAYDYLQLRILPILEEMSARGLLTPVYQSSPRELVRVYRVEKDHAN